MQETGGRSTGFDYLRLALAISIVCWHSVVTAELPGVGPARTGCDRAGVAVRSGSASTSTAARAGHGAREEERSVNNRPLNEAACARDGRWTNPDGGSTIRWLTAAHD